MQATTKIKEWIPRLIAWREQFHLLTRKNVVVLGVVSALSWLLYTDLQNKTSNLVEKVQDPVLHQLAVDGRELVISPLILPVLLICVLLIVSFSQTKNTVGGSEQVVISKRPKRRVQERGVLWESNDQRFKTTSQLVVTGPFCPAVNEGKPCLSLLGHKDHYNRASTSATGTIVGRDQYNGNNRLWCPSCEAEYTMDVDMTTHYKAESVETIRDLVRAKFEAEIRREADVAS